jgi:UDP-N-acetylmuramoyl-L-alanyl-D-glutamate--2,6-diaminopimelate ligase
MLNEKELGKILGIETPSIEIKDIHWKTQDSDANSILFYKIASDEKSEKLFEERISNTSFAWLIVSKDHASRPKNSLVLDESRWPEIQKHILDKLYPLPNLKILAVTGTNGKTTTADLVLQLGELAGKKGMSIGTLGVRELNKTILDFGLTSPSYIDLRKFLFTFGQDKDFCVLEASSHALTQKRLYNLEFSAAGWLSFSQDHLDYHGTMEEYFSAKMLIFNHLKEDAKLFVPSQQVELVDRIRKHTNKVQSASVIDGKLPLFLATGFNRNNLEVAKSMIESAFGIKVQVDFEKIIPPDGRFYIKPYKSNYIVVDFAHTPDALENICRGIKEAFPHHKLKVLFGCGGDRDRTKRPLMGKIAETYADEIYVTSDNPRTEDPKVIIDDILQGIHGSKVSTNVDRKVAVKKAFSELHTNEVLLLAGKGHENYILINGIKHPYSDIEEVENFLNGYKND